MMQRGDIDTIVSWVPEGGKVLDLGCGDGELLHRLQAEKRVEGLESILTLRILLPLWARAVRRPAGHGRWLAEL